MTTAARRAAVRAILKRREVATQEELRTLLARAGHAVTQATLSRDLAHLDARRTHRGYQLPSEAAPAPDPLHAMGALVQSIDHNGQLVVIHTTAGAASAIASALDSARLPEVIGTVAGDDTIFVAPARGTTAARVVHALRRRMET
ncbi:MAG: arginine repressor [Proteobacteria bacterium]|nr:arginine repressor [Pseudomonadota bacterium]